MAGVYQSRIFDLGYACNTLSTEPDFVNEKLSRTHTSVIQSMRLNPNLSHRRQQVETTGLATLPVLEHRDNRDAPYAVSTR